MIDVVGGIRLLAGRNETMTDTNELMRFSGVSRRKLLKVGAGGASIFVAGCTGRFADDNEEWHPPDLADDEDWYPPELNLDTLQAETPYATMHADAWENTFVGAVTDERFIGISLSEGTHTETAQEARIYRCDSDGRGVRLFGRVEAEKKSIEVGESSVEMSFIDEIIQGTMNLEGEEPHPFEVTVASGDAGVYSAETSIDGDDWWFGWIVLPDDRQLGSGKGSNCFRDPWSGHRICRYRN